MSRKTAFISSSLNDK
jgi:hypothetical protein